jgi:hypothetical protein
LNIQLKMVIFYDSFDLGSGTIDLADRTPDTGDSWTKLIAQLVGNENTNVSSSTKVALANTGGLNDGVLYTADATYPGANYTVEVTLALTIDTGSDDWAIIFARVQDSNNMYALQWHGGSGSSELELWSKTTVGGWSSLDTHTSFTLSVNDVIKLEVDGTAIKGYVNDVEKVSATNSDHSNAGKAGLGWGSIVEAGGDKPTGSWDDFTVTEIAAAGTNIKINIGDAWKTVDAAKVNIGDAWKVVDSAKVNIGDAWKTIF